MQFSVHGPFNLPLTNRLVDNSADPAAGWLDYAENAVAGLCRKVTHLEARSCLRLQADHLRRRHCTLGSERDEAPPR